ncbi:MAG: NADH-quinone oxidoreductase subunit M [Cyanobacterium sp.]
MLELLVITPIIGAIALGISSNIFKGKQSKNIALISALITLGISLYISYNFDYSTSQLQYENTYQWLPFIGLNYVSAIDGLSLPLVILNCLLITLAIYSSESGTKTLTKPTLYYILILLLASCVNGALIAQNLLLFFIFYEIKLVPIYLLISIWGNKKGSYAGTKYLLYTAFSGIFVLTGFLALTFLSDINSFDYANIQSNLLPLGKQIIILITIVIGFAIKIPIIPLHTWLPDAYTESSTPVSMLLGGIVSKLGTYGLIRFGLGLFPDTWVNITPYIAILAVISAIYASLIAISQTDIKKMIAYASIAHINFVVLATAAATDLAIVGAIAQMFAHGLIVALLFHLAGILEDKTNTRDINQLHGLMNPYRGLPFVGGLMITAVMASAGIPGMVGFVGEFLTFQGSFAVFPIYTLICLIATGLTAVYFVILLNQIFFGRMENSTGYLPKVQVNERIPAIVLTVLIVFLGINPTWLTMLN